MYYDEFSKALSTEDFQIKHSTDTGGMRDFHFHEAYEIYFSLSSAGKFFIQDKIYPAEKHDLFLLSPVDFHKITFTDAFERYVVTFRPEYIQELSSPNTDLLEYFLNRDINFPYRLHLEEEEAYRFLVLLQKIEEVENGNDYGKDVYKKLLLGELLIRVNQLYRSARVDTMSSPSVANDKISAITKYITAHLKENISLEHLSGVFYMNKQYLCVYFKNHTGFTINTYITNRRIIQAKILLRKNHTVSEVCESVGFTSYAHFIKTFKKLVGITPKQYAIKVKDSYLC